MGKEYLQDGRSLPDDLKEVVYTMRYDQASAVYAEFGPFYAGMVDELGIVLDPTLNESAKGEVRISAADSRTQIWIIPTNEELVVALQAVLGKTHRGRVIAEGTADELKSSTGGQVVEVRVAKRAIGAVIPPDEIDRGAFESRLKEAQQALEQSSQELWQALHETNQARAQAEAAGALARLAALHRAGLTDEWKQELDWQMRRLDSRPGALLALAEGLRDAGQPVEGIRLGRALLERRGGEWDARLLRVVFPFPFRDLLEDEADRVDVDPYLLAGLVRQESSFNPRARSWVGATGLSQIMPATGQWLATGAGVSNFDPSLLTVPEINLRMGARYLRDQLRRYGGKRDLALAAYNAGPGRADRWRRELGYGGDPDAFRERIPFAETREYVQLVLRNSVVYRRLYGGDRSPGLSAGGS